MLNNASELGSSQGIDKDRIYSGVVRDNEDPMMLGRCRIFVEELYPANVPSEHLPWSIPSLDHYSCSEDEGVFYVPEIGSETHIQYQDGNAKFGIYGDFHVTSKTQLDEIKHNYPNRLMLIKLRDRFMILYDRKEHRLFMRNPGNAQIAILGDVDLEVFGNHTERIHGNKSVVVDGTLTEIVGERRQHSKGNTVVSSNGGYKNTSTLREIGCTSHNLYVGGVENYTVTGISYRTAAKMLNNPPGYSGHAVEAAAVPQVADAPEWTAIKGGARGV